MNSTPSAETEARLKSVLAAANQPKEGRLQPVCQGLWRWTVGDTDLALKLFDGPNAHERLRTEAALYRELSQLGAPVPAVVAEAADARALARFWVPGNTLFQRLLATDSLGAPEAEAVRRAWLRMLQALARWNTRITASRRREALRKRQTEIAAVAQAVARDLPNVPSDAIDDLRQTVCSDDLAVLPLDASPQNIVVDGDTVTFIDLELLGLDFADWTYAKYVTALDATGGVRSLVAALPDGRALDRLDASVTLLVLARAAGLWDEPPNVLSDFVSHIPGHSLAARRIRERLRLESSVTSESG